MKALRQSLRQQRKSINRADRVRFARKLLAQCQKSGAFRWVKKIAIYLPCGGEIDTYYIQKFLKKNGFLVYLPVLNGKSLKFAKMGKNYQANKFNIDEPIKTHTINASKLNLVLLPLLGFDAAKNRLGTGGGFYDRALSFKKRQKIWRSPKLIGLAFDCQKVIKLNPQPWDVPLNSIITPTKIYR